MDTNLKLDIYSSHYVPFSVAAYCRGRKFSPEAVNLAQALRKREEAHLAVAAAERQLEEAEARLQGCVQATEARMAREGES